MARYTDIRDALKNFSDSDVPIVIPVFNTVSYARHMIDQLTRLTMLDRVIVCDNGSDYPPMIDYLNELSETCHVVFWGENKGPRYYTENKEILLSMPEYFIVTDPDLILNEHMPKNFIDKMKRIVDMYGVSKAGCAIEIMDEEERSRFFNADQVDRWESNYWTRKLEQYPEVDDLYAAPIDTTFCLHNRDKFAQEIDFARMTCNTSAIRIAGRFTCRHMGWWAEQPLSEEEYTFYKKTHTWSSTEKEKEKLGY